MINITKKINNIIRVFKLYPINNLDIDINIDPSNKLLFDLVKFGKKIWNRTEIEVIIGAIEERVAGNPPIINEVVRTIVIKCYSYIELLLLILRV